MVASDAIGMGLNLNIRRIIFDSIWSYDPTVGGRAQLDESRIKQIAGAHCTSASALELNASARQQLVLSSHGHLD
jgi:hypothetical protein